MQFKTQAEVSGAKYFNDTIEGTLYDKTTVYVKTDLDGSKETAKGFAYMPYEWGKSEEFQKIKHLPFPFLADITFELVTSGKVTKQRVVDLRPVSRVEQKG